MQTLSVTFRLHTYRYSIPVQLDGVAEIMPFKGLQAFCRASSASPQKASFEWLIQKYKCLDMQLHMQTEAAGTYWVLA